MATHPHHDVQRRGPNIYLAPRAPVRPAVQPDVRPSRIQRMTFIFGASTMLWLGIAALFVAL
ncbi:hypothetical protein [Sphingomonas montanisoli]|uniref:Uncharacterized protein n=1 Tax=Sphingomonas montanisoli TaxID=2606412 RepID=A0A5D9C7U9_9SPHN|nr:hypothetical protein [Sphingomonas montanisoli]TZG27202.1 hypothetical protein FYJ91_06145 [Sphingomonas montanisoli]